MRVLELRDEAAGLDAVVVVDHDLFPVSAGGTRMLPDVSVEEVARLARAMTWKFGVWRLPLAGAKAGLRAGEGDREALLAAYKSALEPYHGVFLTGPDMGTRPADFLDGSEDELPLWAQNYDGLGMDDLATGHGVKAAAEAALAHLGRPLEGAAVAIEGFGKVGAGTARACVRAGAALVGVSTVSGLLADPAGLDPEELMALRDEYGDRLVEHGAVPVRSREELFELDCDVVVPGARPDSITVARAERARWSVVAPGANVPYAAGAVEALHARDILAIPDFVSNSGGVHLYESVEEAEGPQAALATIEGLVGEAVTRALETAEAEGITPLAAAFRDVRAFLASETGAGSDVLDELVPG